MGGNVVAVRDEDFRREVLEAGVPVLVDFGASWCAPCRTLDPLLEQLAAQFAGRVKVARVNVEEDHRIAQQYGVRSLPTLLMFKEGRVVEQLGGAVPRSRLEESFLRVVEGGPSALAAGPG